MADKILDFSKIESGKMEIIPVEYDVSSLINDIVNMIKARTEKKKLEFASKTEDYELIREKYAEILDMYACGAETAFC